MRHGDIHLSVEHRTRKWNRFRDEYKCSAKKISESSDAMSAYAALDCRGRRRDYFRISAKMMRLDDSSLHPNRYSTLAVRLRIAAAADIWTGSCIPCGARCLR